MSNKKHIIITALITFLVTSALFFLTIGGGVFSALKTFSGTGMQKLTRIQALIDAYYIYDYDKEKMADMAIEGYTYAIGDPYTMYFDKEDFESFKTSIEGDYVGIGIEVFIDTDNLITVISPFDGSPAQKSGIQPGDKIIGVEGTSVDVSNYNEAINMIKGKASTSSGKEVRLTVKRGEEIFDVSVKRENIVIETAKGKMLSEDIGYIRISSFGNNTAEEFEQSMKNIRMQGAKGVVIDLRNNPGGTLESVVDVADSLLPKCNILTVKDKQGNENKYDSDAKHFDIPVCVLINSNSASAAEVLAGAIADNGRGTLVGEKSFGKGSVQTLFELGDGTAFKVTVAKYYTPGGTCIDKLGITPSAQVELGEDVKNLAVTNIPYEKDTQLQKAKEILEKNN